MAHSLPVSLGPKEKTQMLKYSLFALFVLSISTASAQDAPSAAPITASTVTCARGYNRQDGPVDPSTSFARTDGRMFVVVQLENPTAAASNVTVTVERADQPVGTRRGGVVLEVPARRRYRTVARFTTNREPGRYRAIVLSASGEVVGQTEFEVTGS